MILDLEFLTLSDAIEGPVILVTTAAAMDPWIAGGQPSLSLDLNVGLGTSRPVTATTKVLVEENFLSSVKKERPVPVKKDHREVRSVAGACRRHLARSIAH